MNPVPDLIATESCKLYESLPKRGKPTDREWTTMAAIVQEAISTSEENSSVNLQVVALGTGTKCLGSSELSKQGDVVCDSHAEVVARRSFLLYLYEQIELCKMGRSDKSILEHVTTEHGEPKEGSSCSKNFQVHNGINFHMFISHLPCGDAAIIEKLTDNVICEETDQEELSESGEPLAKRSKTENAGSFSQEEHRTGAKLQFGPLQYEETQTTGKCRIKPGKGDPTLCMSCSDKLAKWQVLGLQGSLLSNFIPTAIRLKSITIGGNVSFNKNSLERALFHRVHDSLMDILKHKEEIDLSYFDMYQCPLVGQSKQNFMEFAENMSPAPASISWYYSCKRSDPIGKDSIQVIVFGRKQGATKKNFGKLSSMVDICRARLFSKFTELYFTDDDTDRNNDTFTYENAKGVSKSYCSVWEILKHEVFSGWTNKPNGLKSFVNA